MFVHKVRLTGQPIFENSEAKDTIYYFFLFLHVLEAIGRKKRGIFLTKSSASPPLPYFCCVPPKTTTFCVAFNYKKNYCVHIWFLSIKRTENIHFPAVTTYERTRQWPVTVIVFEVSYSSGWNLVLIFCSFYGQKLYMYAINFL